MLSARRLRDEVTEREGSTVRSTYTKTPNVKLWGKDPIPGWSTGLSARTKQAAWASDFQLPLGRLGRVRVV